MFQLVYYLTLQIQRTGFGVFKGMRISQQQLIKMKIKVFLLFEEKDK